MTEIRTATMNQVQHTPGPWQVQPGVYDTNPETACEFPRGPEVIATPGTVAYCNLYGEADANLIAAAPDMLAALRAIENYCGMYTNPMHDDALADQIRAAIAKATGEALS